MEQRKPQENDLEDYVDMEVGDILRRARLHYGQSLQDIERTLRIRESQIDAIERGEVDKLPGRVYAIGFVRSYAEYLGLDGDKIVHLFKVQYMDVSPSRKELVFPVAASETRTPPVWLIVVSIVVAVAILAAWTIRNRTDRSAVAQVPPVPEEITQRLEDEAVLPPAQDGFEGEETGIVDGIAGNDMPAVADAMTGDAEEQQGIVLHITEKSWVEIRGSDGTSIVSRVLEPGDQYFVPDSPGLSMSLGNAGGVEILLNGRMLKPLGARGDILRNIPLDTSYLKTLEFREEAPQPDENVPDSAPVAPDGNRDSRGE